MVGLPQYGELLGEVPRSGRAAERIVLPYEDRVWRSLPTQRLVSGASEGCHGRIRKRTKHTSAVGVCPLLPRLRVLTRESILSYSGFRVVVTLPQLVWSHISRQDDAKLACLCWSPVEPQHSCRCRWGGVLPTPSLLAVELMNLESEECRL